MASSPRASRKAPASGGKKAAARPAPPRTAKAPARKPAPAKASRPAKAAAAKAPASRKAAAKPASRPAKASRPAPKQAAKAATVGRPAPAKKPAGKAPAARPPVKVQARTPVQPAAKAPVKPPARPVSRGNSPARKAPLPAPGNTARRPTRAAASAQTNNGSTLIHGISPYQPTPGEPYMNERQLEHFRQILLAWKRELMEEVDRTVHHMQDEASNFPDPNDRATQESEFGLELRTRDRERKLLKKIDSALERIDDGSYGFCEETGEEIGLKRLEARPVATLSLEAQERRELAERQYGERDDRFR